MRATGSRRPPVVVPRDDIARRLESPAAKLGGGTAGRTAWLQRYPLM